MIWILFSVAFGSGIGFFTYRYQALFVGMVIAGAPIAFVVSRAWLFLIIMVWDLPSSRDGDALNGDTIKSDVIDILTHLPSEINWAIALFPVSMLLGRLFTWFLTHALAPEDILETREGRKSRLHEFYGYDAEHLGAEHHAKHIKGIANRRVKN